MRLKSRACLSTAPATTSSTRSPPRPKRATRPSIAAVSMAWLDSVAYGPLARAKGIRLPPTTAAWRGEVMAASSHVPSIEVAMPSDRYQQLTATAARALRREAARAPRVAPAAALRARPAGARRPRAARRRGPHGRDAAPPCSPRSAPRSARPGHDEDGVKLGALVFDATGIENSAGLQGALRVLPRRDPRPRPERPARRARHAARAVRGPPARRSRSARWRASSAPPPRSCARAPRASSSTSHRAARRNAESTLRFLLSAKSAYVSGQVIRIGAGESATRWTGTSR